MTQYAKFRSAQSWDDLPPVPITAAKLGSSAPTIATFKTDIEQYTFDATNDYVIGATEVTHTFAEGVDIVPHVHWATNGNEVGAHTVQFQLKWSVCIPGAAAAAQATAVTGDLTIPGGTADRTNYISDFTTNVSGAGIVIGTYIVWRFERIAAGAGTPPAADPFVLAVGFHARQDSTGSMLISTK
jgi:hypothetical protein